MQEVMQLREEQLMTAERMDLVNQSMQAAELKQKQLVSFLSKVLHKPTFLGHLKQLRGQREIASIRRKRKFIKHHQHQPFFSASAEAMSQQIVKYAESGEGSDALHVSEQSEGNKIPEHLLKDIADKLDLDTGGGEVIGGSSETKDLKGKNNPNSQMDTEFPVNEYLISLPDDIADLESEYISQEAMFPDAIVPADSCVRAGGWNVCLDVGGSMLSSEPAVWDDSCGYYNDARGIESAAGSCSLWDLGWNATEEDLDIDSFMGGESSPGA